MRCLQDIETKPIKTTDELWEGAKVLMGDNKDIKPSTCVIFHSIDSNVIPANVLQGNFEAPDLTQTCNSLRPKNVLTFFLSP